MNKPNKLTASNLDIPAITRGKGGASKKYRPSLTAAQIAHILALAKTESGGISETSFSLISTLAPFQAKIENDGITPAYTTQPAKPKANSLESLGGLGDGTGKVYIAGYESKEDYWAACYGTFLDNPAGCNLDQINAAQEYRYLNDLMTPEEEAAYTGCDNAPVFTLGKQNRRDWEHCRERSRSTTTECTTIFGLTSCKSR